MFRIKASHLGFRIEVRVRVRIRIGNRVSVGVRGRCQRVGLDVWARIRFRVRRK
jgi:hypothetical protein